MTPETSAPLDSTESNEPVRVVIATVGRPVGLDGWCRVFPCGNTLATVALPLQVEAGIGKPEITVILKDLRKDGKGYRGHFAGYENREQVDSIKNFQMFLPKGKLPKNQPDEYYHFELEGMAVYGIEKNEYVGTVINVYNYPTVDALEVAVDKGKTVIIPLTKETVREINKERRTIFVEDSIIEELL